VNRLCATALTILTLGATAATVRAENPPCITWRSQVVLALVGHNHVVVIENGCNKPATCVVSTDVAPDPIQATVPAKQKVELVTFRGSSSSTFKAKVDCTLR
jgi:hypothetical protein